MDELDDLEKMKEVDEIREWNLYVAKWTSGHLSVYVLSEGIDEVDWLDLLDVNGDPSAAVVKRIEANDKSSLTFQQDKPDSNFHENAFGKLDTLEEMFERSRIMVWPSGQHDN